MEIAAATTAILAGLFTVLVTTYVWSSNREHRRRAADMIAVMIAVASAVVVRLIPVRRGNDSASIDDRA